MAKGWGKDQNLKPITVASKVPAMSSNCTISGWGKVNAGVKENVYPYPQIANVTLLPMDQCDKVYKAIPKNTLCFGSVGVSVCLVG